MCAPGCRGGRQRVVVRRDRQRRRVGRDACRRLARHRSAARRAAESKGCSNRVGARPPSDRAAGRRQRVGSNRRNPVRYSVAGRKVLGTLAGADRGDVRRTPSRAHDRCRTLGRMNCRSLRAAILTLGLTAPCLAFAQTTSERLWMAGRYDRNHLVMYFSAVKFNGTVPPDAAKIAEPKADAFFYPVGLPAAYVSQLQKKTPRTEKFSVGDRYDLLLDGGRVATITLDRLVGFENDEQVGNDSYIGALGRVTPRDIPRLTKDY